MFVAPTFRYFYTRTGRDGSTRGAPYLSREAGYRLSAAALQRDDLTIGKGEAFGLQSDNVDEQR